MSDKAEAFADRMVEVVSADVLRRAKYDALVETADYVALQWGHVEIAADLRARAETLTPSKKPTDGRPPSKWAGVDAAGA